MKSLFKNRDLWREAERNGYVIIPLLNESQLQRLWRLYEESIDHANVQDLYESSRHNSLKTNQQINQAICAELTAAGNQIFTGCDLYGGTFMAKSHHDSTVLPAHQDWSVVEEDEYSTLFIWCALQDVTAVNGGLFVLDGSHKYFKSIRSGSYPSNRYILPSSMQHCAKDISLKAGEAILYSDQLFHGSHSNQSSADRVIVTGRVIEQGARLVYFHKKNEVEVDVYAADQDFYLSHIDALAKGKLPSRSTKLYSRAYRHIPTTDESLRLKIKENLAFSENEPVKCQLFKDTSLQEAFDRDGYVVVDLIEQQQVDDLLAFYNRLDHAPMPTYGFQVSLDNERSDFVRVIADKLMKTVTPFVDQVFRNHRIFTASFVVKEKNPLGVVPPHQDWTFVNEQEYWSASIWCPLVDVDMRNGCLGVIRGSHRFYDHVRPSPSPQYEPPFKDQVFTIFPYLKLIEMKAGQALVFNNRTFHASPPNTADQPRVAFGLGITHQDAEIQHYYLLPRQERVLLERFKVNSDFFFAYNNARLSAMHEKGEKPQDLNSTGLFEYTCTRYDAPQLIEMIEAAGNVRNDDLVETMAALFDYNADGTPKNASAAEEQSGAEPSSFNWKVYTFGNIYRELQSRIINRSAGEPIWKIYTPSRVVSEVRHRLAGKSTR
jgi:ectoine hydroxylase-related dioxygenase (phytanoyl-CoA dioxygenase family)